MMPAMSPLSIPPNTSNAKCWQRYIRLYPPRAASKKSPTWRRGVVFLEALDALDPLVFLVSRMHSTNASAKNEVVCPEGNEYQLFILTPSTSGSWISGICSVNHVRGLGATKICLVTCVKSVESNMAVEANTPFPIRLKSSKATHTTYGNHSATCV